MKTKLLALALLALAAIGSSGDVLARQAAGAADDSILAAAAAKYDFAHWAAGPRRAGCDLSALRLQALTSRPSERAGSGVVRRFADAQDRDVLMVEMLVADTTAGAHARLLQHIALVQSPKTLPSAASRGIVAGDVGFIGYAGREQDRIAWLAFASGNVEFRVRSLDPSTLVQPDVRDAVQRLSALVQEAAIVKDGEPLPAPAFERFAAQKATCRVGESLRLDAAVKDPTGGIATLDWEVAGSAQGYVEDGDDGAPRFHATKDGRADVTLFALGVNGVTSSKQLSIEVARAK